MGKNDYSNFVKEKTVALVGPSWHTKGTKQKDLIESYDIVVRVNRGYMIPDKIKEDIGDRTDILYCSLSEHYFRHKCFTKKGLKNIKNKIKWICPTHYKDHYSNIEKLKKNNKNINIKIHVVNNKYYNFIYNKINKKLTCGIIAIYDLLQYDIKCIYITGFSFYDIKVIGKRRMYYSQYKHNGLKYHSKVFSAHNLKKELLFFKKLCNKDRRIICDNILTKIMKRY